MLLVNARLLYISIDGYQYSLLVQVNMTISCTSIALPLTD